jgi:hypothetical protein
MIRPAIILLALGPVLPAAAQTPVPLDGPAFCVSGSASLLSDEPDVDAVTRQCRVGDTIGINNNVKGAGMLIARLCDFTKSIVPYGSATICVFGGDRGQR